MKRSGNVGLVVMGGAAFAATFAAGMAYFAWQKPSHAASPQAAASAQNCTTRPDGTQSCQQRQRSFVYYLIPRFSSGSSWGWGGDREPRRSHSAALTNSSRSYTPATNASSTTRGGFGSTVSSGSYRTSSAGG